MQAITMQLLLAGLFVITGCSSQFILPSPGANHPADPLAKAAPVPESSSTLASAPKGVSAREAEITETEPGMNERAPGMNHSDH